MSQTTDLTAGAAANPAALRIVLFGMPDAGKSSLLGALAQAAQTQEHVLNGHLTDPSHGLAALQHRLYEEMPRETLEEVVPYPVAFDPFAPAGAGHLEAVLVDCDGRVANELLARRRPLNVPGADGSLATAVLDADALVLVIDAAAPPAQVEADFAEFGRFLRLLEQSRGRRSDVGGLPVFLVLTKCDLLAHADDTPAAWMERIEDRKRQLGQRFQEFLARQAAQGPLPFGSIDLHLWATAVKRPALAGNPARPRDPYGVAELFRQCLDQARLFRARRRRSHRRLLWTLGGTTGLMGLLAAVAGILLVTRHEPPPAALTAQVYNYRAREGTTPSARLQDPERKLRELREIEADTEFDHLAADDQAYVRSRLRELQDYVDYRTRLLRLQRELADVHREEDLEALATRLRKDLALPAHYQTEWSQTEAARLRENLLKEAETLDAALANVEQWYRRRVAEGDELWSFTHGKPADAPSWARWLQQAKGVLEQPFPAEGLGATGLTAETLLHFDRVERARRDWERVEQRLGRLRDVVAVLGLAGAAPDGSREPLDIPESFSLAQAHERLEKFKSLYPNLLKNPHVTDLPPAAADDLRRAARINFDHLLEVGRKVVLDRLQAQSPDGKETPEVWRGLRDWLNDPEELRDWRVLATWLAQLQDPEARDPVTALAAFLRQDRFDLDVRSLTLEVPQDRRLRPVGPVTVFHGSGAGPAAAALVFQPLNDAGRRDPQRDVVIYNFRRESGGPLVYRPGDTFYASLPAKKDRDPAGWMVTWARSRSELYQFESLTRPPRLHRPDQPNTEGELLQEVTLAPAPESGFPRVPDLMPVVKLRKR